MVMGFGGGGLGTARPTCAGRSHVQRWQGRLVLQTPQNDLSHAIRNSVLKYAMVM
jgi:hypothetical protein